MVDGIWRLCNIDFDSGGVTEDKGKEERTECKNSRGISLLSIIGKIFVGILVDKSL